MKTDIIERKYKTFMFWGIIATVSGLTIICIGVFMYIFGEPQPGTNLSTLQPVIIDGSKPLLLGFTLLIIGCYRLIFKKNAFNKIREFDSQNEIEEYTNRLKNGGYSKKVIRRRLKAYRQKEQKT